MSLHRFFAFLLLLTISSYSEGQTNIGKVIPNNVFTAIKKSKTSFNDTNLEAIYFSTLMPKKIVVEEFEGLYNELGSFEKDKKIYNSSIQTKGELLTLITSIVKKDKRVHVYISDKDKLKQEISINNLQESFDDNYINEEDIDKSEDKINQNFKFDRPPERDVRESQPTISVNYRFVDQDEDNDISKNKSRKNNLNNEDNDWLNNNDSW